jgi:LPS sulfotransferase NodH
MLISKLRSIGNDSGDYSLSFRERVRYLNSLPKNCTHNKRVVIFSTPRSGSTFLADQIGASGLVGSPDEWLNPIWVKALISENYAKNVLEALDWVACRTSSPNGIFSINVQLHHYILWKRDGLDLVKWGFDDAVYLKREDKISQAYSLAKARLYEKWDQTSASENQSDGSPNIAIYMILGALSDIYFWSEYYEKTLKQHIKRTISYEDYCSNHQLILDLIAQFSGVRLDSLPLESSLKKQQTISDNEAIELLKTKIKL